MNSLSDIRKNQYNYHIGLYPYVDNWRRNPYTWIKSRIYMEISAVFIYFLLKTKIKPNTLSITYCLLGFLGGILLAIPAKQATLVAVFIFFFKGIFDWSDGHLARMRAQTSLTGAILDPYGSLIGTMAFQIGLGLYVAQKSGMVLFYYLVPLIPLFYLGVLQTYALYVLFIEHLSIKNIREYKKTHAPSAAEGHGRKVREIFNEKYRKAYKRILNFLDERARTVDFVCLLVLLELFTPIFLTWLVFLGFVIKHFLVFMASFYIVAKGNWAEEKLEGKIEEMSKALEPDK